LVIPLISTRIVFCCVFGILISVADSLFGLPVNPPILGTIIPSVVLGLLLVFRTNTAYDRYWEGRRLWTSIGTAALNVVRQIWTSVAEIENEERAKKYSVIPLLIAFAAVTKLYLRAEPVNAELKELMPSSEYSQLKTASNPRLEIT